ncbi:MAG: hypothetical protein ACSLFF_00480 [Solirubrobacterales bacterium]
MLTLLLLAVAVFAAQASAAPKDKNGNGIPDAWEKSHDLSTKKDQGNRDADGATDRAESKLRADGVLVLTVRGTVTDLVRTPRCTEHAQGAESSSK